MVSSILRMLVSLILSLLLLIRLDRVVFMRGFEFLDLGELARKSYYCLRQACTPESLCVVAIIVLRITCSYRALGWVQWQSRVNNTN